MVDLNIHTVDWTGFQGAPGTSTFVTFNLSVQTAEDMRAALQTFFSNINGVFPNQVNLKIAPFYKTVDELTGALKSETLYTGPTPTIPGSGGASFAGPAGAVVDWLTATIGTRRNLRGRTFLVPLSSGSYDGTGTLLDSSRDLLRTQAATFAAAVAPQFCVWRRPRPAQVAPKVPRPAVIGKAGAVVSSKVPDMVAMLRSRR